MAIRNLVYKEDELLRKCSRDVVKFDDRLEQLLDDMAETMYENNGVGLAAPQVGVLRRVVVIDAGDDQGLIELINPKIIEESGEQGAYEACLSCPGDSAWVVRPMQAKVRAQNRKGEWFEVEGEGLLARAFCHELDHLDGILFLDVATLPPDDSDELEDGN